MISNQVKLIQLLYEMFLEFNQEYQDWDSTDLLQSKSSCFDFVGVEYFRKLLLFS